MTTKTLVPELRFPDFEKLGDWEMVELGDCFDYKQPTKYLVKSTAYDNSYKTPVLTAGKTFILGYTNETEGVFSEELPVVIFDDFTTASKLVDFPFKAKSSAMKILQGKEGCNVRFFYEEMQTIKYEVGAHERHWISIFSKFLIPKPSQAEQKKIADCLGSLDELIASTAASSPPSKTTKGLPATLPRRRRNHPKLRFPEFENAGEWESLEIGEFGKVITGSTPATSNGKFYDGPRMFVSPADISGHQFIEKTNTTLTDLGFEKTRPIRAGSTLFVCIGSTIGKVAQNRVECATNQQINAVIPSKRFSDAFVFYCLLRHSKNIASFAGNQAVPIINKSLFSSIPVLVPELQEQQKIADCLSDLDALITAQTVQIAALKEHKKGLMQQLFPNPDFKVG